MPKLLFITTTNLSTNPRLLKELKLANKSGYECTFIGFKLGNWSDKTEPEHLKTLDNTKPIYLSTTKAAFIGWLFSTMVWKWSMIFNKIFKKSLRLSAYAHNKRTWQIIRELKKIKSKYDIVIAHNLGALYPAYYFSKKKNISFAFDIEDYHPGEKCSPIEKLRRKFLMQKLLPKAAYISYASPLIGQHSLELFSNRVKPKEKVIYIRSGSRCISVETYKENNNGEPIEQPENFLINNSFSEKEFELKENQSEKIQFVWFSQNIAQGRGLDLIIPALAKFKDKVHITLVGNLYNDFEESFLKDYLDFIDFQAPLPQEELNMYLCKFDIGLAIELSSSDFNRDICLTNKIFAYTQAGLYILATDTSAQKKFIEEQNLAISKSDFDFTQSPEQGSLSEVEMPASIGLLSGQTTEAMEKAIEKIIINMDEIRANKKIRFNYAKKISWDLESEKLKRIWEDLLTLRS